MLLGVGDGPLRYGGPLRRRQRLSARAGRGAVQKLSGRVVRVVDAFWLDDFPNFGDALTPWLFSRVGIVARHRKPSSAFVAGVGSILEMLPSTYAGYVWGSGLLKDEEKSLPNARFLAVRGPLTRDRLGAPGSVILGDPGLLVGAFVPQGRTRRWKLGLVPHHYHQGDEIWRRAQAERPRDVKVIDVRRGATSVVREIAECERVLSTSLHGLIVADSLGVPACWSSPQPVLWGGTYKFRDHEGALGIAASRRIELRSNSLMRDVSESAYAPDPRRIRKIQGDLLRVLKQVPSRPLIPWHKHSQGMTPEGPGR